MSPVERMTTPPTPYARLLQFVDPYCPRETQPMPTVSEPGPVPLCTCGLHEVLDDILHMDRVIRALCEQRDTFSDQRNQLLELVRDRLDYCPCALHSCSGCQRSRELLTEIDGP